MAIAAVCKNWCHGHAWGNRVEEDSLCRPLPACAKIAEGLEHVDTAERHRLLTYEREKPVGLPAPESKAELEVEVAEAPAVAVASVFF